MPFRFADIAATVPGRNAIAPETQAPNLFAKIMSENAAMARAKMDKQLREKALQQDAEQYAQSRQFQQSEADRRVEQWRAAFDRQGSQLERENQESDRKSRVEHAGMLSDSREQKRYDLAQMLGSAALLPRGMLPSEAASGAGLMPPAPPPVPQAPQSPLGPMTMPEPMLPPDPTLSPLKPIGVPTGMTEFNPYAGVPMPWERL
jgi:hypothetical protein